MMGIGLTAGRMSAFQIDWNQAIQKRLHVTSNVIALTKEIKLLGVTDVVFRIVQELRRDEVDVSHKFRRLLVVTVVFGELLDNIVCLSGRTTIYLY